MSPRVSKTERLISFIGERGLIRARDLASANIDRKILQRACERGLVECIGRGAYRLLGAKENPIAIACKRVRNSLPVIVDKAFVAGGSK
jgi:Transcriptional regulator, AbiEi antitoxin